MLILIGIDQITKYLAVSYLKDSNSKIVIENVLSFTYVENRGAAFGLMSDTRLFLLILSTIIIIGIIYLIINCEKQIGSNKSYKIMLYMILSGAIGNMIDRTFIGFVVDFVELTFINFAVFNFADILITVGGVVIIGIMLLDKKNKK